MQHAIDITFGRKPGLQKQIIWSPAHQAMKEQNALYFKVETRKGLDVKWERGRVGWRKKLCKCKWSIWSASYASRALSRVLPAGPKFWKFSTKRNSQSSLRLLRWLQMETQYRSAQDEAVDARMHPKNNSPPSAQSEQSQKHAWQPLSVRSRRLPKSLEYPKTQM